MTNKKLGRIATFPSIFNDYTPIWNKWLNEANLMSPTLPAVNIKEDKDAYSLSVAAPGLHKKDLDISIDGNILTISGQKEEDKQDTDEQYEHREYNYSSFSRSFTLPEDVQPEKIEADYDGGILKVSLPKNQKSVKQQRKAVEIK